MYFLARFLISLAAVIVGAVLVNSALDDLDRTQAAANWPSVVGVVKSVDTHIHIAGHFRESRGDAIAYVYVVDGEEYVGHQASFAGGAIADYEPGEEVDVYYDPYNHALSVLSVEPTLAHWLRIMLGAGFIVVAAVLWKRLA